ncbi:MAG TPA: hypothetical protein VEA41_14560, partial [Salinarimonas sp.]|nr:hypothetical protein [Salinarimonas sp.]
GLTDPDRVLMILGTAAEGVQTIYNSNVASMAPLTVSKTFPWPSAEPLTEVYNETAGVVMTEGSGTQRNEYRVIDGVLTLTAEHDGDQIRVTCAAPASVPSGRGRSPQPVGRQGEEGFCTGQEEASADPDEERANWHDVIRVQFEDPDAVFVAGNTVEALRGYAFASPLHPPTISRDVKNGEGTWAAVDSADLLARWIPGLVLLSQDLMDSLAGRVCFRVEGRMWQCGNGPDARMYNELRSAVEMLDQLWVSPGSIGSGVSGVSGSAQMIDAYAGHTVQGSGASATYWPTGWGFGLSKEGVHNWYLPDVTIGDYRITSWPAWVPSGGHPYYQDLALRTAAPGYDAEPLPDLGPSAAKPNYTPNREDLVPGEVGLYLNVYGANGQNRAGWIPTEDSGGIASTSYVQADFSLIGVPFGIGSVLANLPDGAEIVEAIARLMVAGLEYRASSHTTQIIVSDPSPTPAQSGFSQVYTINGHVVRQYVRAFGESTPETDVGNTLTEEQLWVNHGPVGFALVGKRKNSKNVIDVYGVEHLQPAFELISSGAALLGSQTEVTSDQWAMVDVTDAVRGVQSLLDTAVGFDGFELWPTVGGVAADAGPEGLAAYARSLLPSITTSFESDYPTSYTREVTMSGAYFRFDSLAIEGVLMRFRLNGVIQETWVPLNEPRAM